MSMDVALSLLTLALLVVAGYYIGRAVGYRHHAAERAVLRDALAVSDALAKERQAYIDGLWMPKECPVHVFSKEPVLRKNGQLKFICQRCGDVRWTTKAA
jgi:hypothetical protein